MRGHSCLSCPQGPHSWQTQMPQTPQTKATSEGEVFGFLPSEKNRCVLLLSEVGGLRSGPQNTWLSYPPLLETQP